MKPKIRFGPAGMGPVKDVEETFRKFKETGIRASEIPFTYGIFIKKEDDMKQVKEASEKYDIKLSIHAPYWINLNSKEHEKIQASKQRILKCCEVGEKLGAYRVVFHPGFYAGMEKEETYRNIKKAIVDMQFIIRQNGWKIKLAPETMGKVNVFGSIEQIARLVEETGCDFCIDFAHILARDKKIDFGRIKALFGDSKKWHCHFSGIEYGEKGERKHRLTSREDWEGLLGALCGLGGEREIVIINESPNPVGDAVLGKKVYEEIKEKT